MQRNSFQFAEVSSLRLPNNNYFRGLILYFGIRERKQILIIEERFIIFQYIPH